MSRRILPELQRFALCTHCFGLRVSANVPFRFSINEVQQAIMNVRVHTPDQSVEVVRADSRVALVQQGVMHLFCHNVKTRSRAVRITSMCPDWCMQDIPLIPPSDIVLSSNKLGEGGGGAVWEGTWGMMKVRVHAQHHLKRLGALGSNAPARPHRSLIASRLPSSNTEARSSSKG